MAQIPVRRWSSIWHIWCQNEYFWQWHKNKFKSSVPTFKGCADFFFILIFSSLPSSRQEDRFHFFDCACSNKEETGRLRLALFVVLYVSAIRRNLMSLSWPRYVELPTFGWVENLLSLLSHRCPTLAHVLCWLCVHDRKTTLAICSTCSMTFREKKKKVTMSVRFG